MGYTTLIVLAGTGLLGACSGMVGSFAVLRRRALMGDALAHAALPGVCLAFLILGERSLPAMLVGALVTGVLGVAIVTGLRFGTRIKEDAAIGIVLSVFYGAGIALSRYIQSHGSRGSRAGLDSYILGKTSAMIREDVLLIAAASLFSLLLIVLLFKEFKVVVFDPEFAHAQGWPSFRLDLLLMVMIAVTVVIGLPAVGVVLMAALLIIPAAAARFWTDRLGTMLGIAALFGAVTGAAGTLASSRFEWAAGPAIVIVGAGLFGVSMLFGPRRGLLRQLWVEHAFRKRTRQESALRRLAEIGEGVRPQSASSLLDRLKSDPALLDKLIRGGWMMKQSDGGWEMTEAGRAKAAAALRAYRMVDLYLSEFAGQLNETAVTSPEELVQQIPPELRSELERKLEGEA